MVFFFTSTVVDPPVTLFMGLDKHENEELIKWGWPEDVWFHVDKVTFQAIKKSTSLRNVMTKFETEFLTEIFCQVSSAHVYLRLAPGQTLEEVRYFVKVKVN